MKKRGKTPASHNQGRGTAAAVGGFGSRCFPGRRETLPSRGFFVVLPCFSGFSRATSPVYGRLACYSLAAFLIAFFGVNFPRKLLVLGSGFHARPCKLIKPT